MLYDAHCTIAASLLSTRVRGARSALGERLWRFSSEESSREVIYMAEVGRRDSTPGALPAEGKEKERGLSSFPYSDLR